MIVPRQTFQPWKVKSEPPQDTEQDEFGYAAGQFDMVPDEATAVMSLVTRPDGPRKNGPLLEYPLSVGTSDTSHNLWLEMAG